MHLPFTTEQFFAVFAEYNMAVWPAQFVLVAAAFATVVAAVVSPSPTKGQFVSAVLAGLWAWLGIGYHLAFFSKINPLAYGFAAVSLAACAIFLWQGVLMKRLRFAWSGGVRSFAGGTCIVFAILGYPAWAIAAGHTYPAFPTFGLPCPTTIYTIGMLGLLVKPAPVSVFVVPVVWCLIGGQSAFLLGVPQDLGLFVAAAIGVMLAATSNRSGQVKATTA